MTFPPCVRAFGLLLGLLSCVHGTAQFVVERSPWLDDEAVTEDPVRQTWAVANQHTTELLEAELTVEGLNPRKPVRLRIDEDTTLKLAPYRRYGRLCVEPDFMLYADFIYADPEVPADTLLLEPLSIGLETALPAIEFMPGTEDLYDLARNGYFLTAIESDTAAGGIFHSDIFALVDRSGRIRGYYDGTDTEEVDQLLEAVEQLWALNE